MFVYTSKLIKHISYSIVSRKTSKLLRKNTFSKNILLNQFSKATTSQIKVKNVLLEESDNLVIESDLKFANKLIHSHTNVENINWNEVESKLNELKVKNITSTIIRAVTKTRNIKAAVSYYKYMLHNNKSLTVYDLMRYCQLLSGHKTEIYKYEEIITSFYDILKPYVLQSELIRNFLLGVVSEIPDCLTDLIETVLKSPAMLTHYRWSVFSLKLGRPDLAFKILREKGGLMDYRFVLAYISYMMDLAKEKKFSPSVITDLANICQCKGVTMLCENFFVLLKNLVSTLNNSQSNYVWSIDKCNINNSICSNCKQQLVPKPISESDLEKLRKHFVPDVLLHKKDAFLSTSNKEISEFADFLSTCKPYNMVLDGLNILYQRKMNGCQNFLRIINHFIEKDFSVLFIARKHAQHKINKIMALQSKTVQSKMQSFFVENVSDDDLFVLLAALNSNLKTYYLSGDLMTPYGTFLDFKIEYIYLKWKLYHRYSLEGTDIIAPEPHLGLPQLTYADPNGESFSWHLSYIKDKTGKAKIRSPRNLSWICLNATKKK